MKSAVKYAKQPVLEEKGPHRFHEPRILSKRGILCCQVEVDQSLCPCLWEHSEAVSLWWFLVQTSLCQCADRCQYQSHPSPEHLLVLLPAGEMTQPEQVSSRGKAQGLWNTGLSSCARTHGAAGLKICLDEISKWWSTIIPWFPTIK